MPRMKVKEASERYRFKVEQEVLDVPPNKFDEPVHVLMDRVWQDYADRPALNYLGETWTYRELQELTKRFANAFYELGVQKRETILVYIPNSPTLLGVFFGAMRIGAIPVMVSPTYTTYEIEYLINDSGATTAVCQDTNFGYVAEVYSKTGLKRVIVSNYSEFLPWYKKAVGAMFEKVPQGEVRKGPNVYLVKDIINKFPPAPPKVDIDPRADLVRILYTGGTTGFPKGVITNHTAVVSNIYDISGHLESVVGSGGEDVVLMAAPLYHEFAQGWAFATALSKGNPLVLMPIMNTDVVLELVQRRKTTAFAGVPTLYRMILENDRIDYYNCTSLKYCTVAGDPLPQGVYDRWKAKFGVGMQQCFGATETGFVSMTPVGRELSTVRAIGVPLPSRSVMVVDSETLKEVPRGEVGEMLVHSYYTLKHYWNKPEETEAAYVKVDGKTWYRTGDQVMWGDDGQLYYIDRSPDMIKVKGYRISASEVEIVLQNHPMVIQSCVVGVPDPKGTGERIKAIVVLKDDAKGVSGQELIALCRQRLAPYKVPSYIEFRDMLPKSKVGKLLRREVRDEERRKAQEERDKGALRAARQVYGSK